MNLSEKIFAKIKWLRKQPDSVKTWYIWVSAMVVFAVVVLLWVGVFKKYERSSPDNNKSTEVLIGEGKKLKDNIDNTVKELKPKETPVASPEVSPEISPEASPDMSPAASPEAYPVVSPQVPKK